MLQTTTPEFFTPRIHWRNAIFIISTAVVAAVATPLYLIEFGFSWSMLALFLVSYAGTGMSITAGYHRMLSHRSYEGRKWLKLVYLLFGAAAFQGSALQWCADHRRHHRQVDTDEDPHNIRRGFFWAHMGWLMVIETDKYNGKYPVDLANDPWIVWQDRYYVPIAVAIGFGLPTLVGWALGDALGGLLFGGFLRVVASHHSTFFINSLAHTMGSRPYSDKQTARDSMVMAFLAFGEGYHNFHHVFASDYRNGIKWYHWDPTKWLIRATELCGGAYRLKTVPHAEILRARLRNEYQRLLSTGAPPDRVTALKQRVEDALKQWRTLREDYGRFKRTMQAESRRRLRTLKADLKVARLEFKFAWAQWAVYRRALAPARA